MAAKRKSSIPLADTGIDWSSPVGEPVVTGRQAEAEAEQAEPSGPMRRYLGDTALSVGQGAVQGVRMLTDIAGADNAVSGGLRTVEDFIGGLKSAEAKKDQQEIARILKEAEGKGVLDQVVAGVRAFSVAPMQTMAQAAGTSLPTIGAALIPGVGPAAVAARFAAPLAVGAAQGAGAVKSSIYDEVKQRAIQEGRSPAEAEQLAVQAQEYAGDNGGQIALGAGLGAWAGKSGLEGAASRLVHGAGGRAVPSMASRVALGAAAEGIPEAVQGGQEKYASNVAQDRAGFQTDAMSGVVAGATMEALAGAATGGAMGIPSPGGAPPVVDPAGAPALLPDTGPMSRAVNAATVAARGTPLDFTPTALPPKGNGLAVKDEPDTTALDFEADPRFAGAIAFPNGKAPDQPLFASKQLADVHIGEQGAFGELEPVEAGGGQWTVQQTPEAANRISRANIESWMAKAQPMEEATAKDMAKRSESELNKPMTALPMPDGEGWTVVPRQWVSAPVLLDYTERAAAATRAREEQQAAADEPVGRAPRTERVDPVEIDPAGPNAVAQFVAQQETVNTPAARAFVQGYRSGRITDADVMARIAPEAQPEPTADERLAAAAQAGQVESDSTPPGLILNREGKPFKTEMAAAREQKKHAGSEVVEVDGGHAVQIIVPEPSRARAEKPVAEPETAVAAAAPVEPTVDQPQATVEAAPAVQQRNRMKAGRAEWTEFPDDSGTKGIPRADMPQIAAEHRGAMVNFLSARGIAHEQDEVAADDLKPTQAEYSTAKVEKAKAYEGGDRSILVSSDGHVLDGHHQWMAKKESGDPVKVIRLNAPIDKLLDEVREFPSATASEGAAAAKTPPAAPVAETSKPQPAKPKKAPKSFRKTHKVTTQVFMEETGTFVDQEIDAETALKALDSDIDALRAFRACITGG